MLITLYTEKNKKLADYNPSTRNSINLDSAQEFQSISTGINPICLHKPLREFYSYLFSFVTKRKRVFVLVS